MPNLLLIYYLLYNLIYYQHLRWSDDVVTFAIAKKLYDPNGGVPFSFSDVYDPLTFSGARSGEARYY